MPLTWPERLFSSTSNLQLRPPNLHFHEGCQGTINMDRPAQTLYTPPSQRSAPQDNPPEDNMDDSFEDSYAEVTPEASASELEEDTTAVDINNDAVAELPTYDTTMLTLASLQEEYGETFADEDVPAAEAFAQRKALKHKMGIEYHRMVITAIKTFHLRTRCPNCKQTPITIDYFAMNHSLPKRAWTIEMWYWEDNTASVECGRVSWNGSFAPDPVWSPEENGGMIAVKTPLVQPPLSYSKAVARHGKSI
ncbi:hypothetical protein BKA64DRAFT_642462 [Cadophora sp. MPI-SDFR-AT-0126]|nr:hypothetical protein BKA64DRAFT_642462 [Leotiomycetes sp. MPI-SDFR-AT-0126]